MTGLHEDFLELAAAALDFPLSADERASLDGHLEGCLRCRREVVAFAADQRDLVRLPRHMPPQVVTEQVWAKVRPGRRSAMPMLRLVLVAALVALVAMSLAAVGAEILRRERPDLSVVPLPTARPSTAPVVPTASPVAPDVTNEPSATPIEPSATPSVIGFPAGSLVEVVTVGLRVRTEPTVDDAVSVKLDPLLGEGTRLRVVEGPVSADDYDWYLVEALSLPHRGWVAAADHDGQPWIDIARAAVDPVPMSDIEAGLRDALRTDVATGCTPRRTDLPLGALAGIECPIVGEVATRVGAYRFADARQATLTYLARLIGYGVAPGSGDCTADMGGDTAWMPGGGDVAGGEAVEVDGFEPLAVGRVGCFVNENDIANVRVTCGSTYVGVLGRDDDIAALYRWAWGSDEPSATGVPPTICRSGG